MEEIDIIQAGHNYMWRTHEGALRFKPKPMPPVYVQDSHVVGRKTWPVFEYLHGCSPQHPTIECIEPGFIAVIGGLVYRGAGRNKCLHVSE